MESLDKGAEFQFWCFNGEPAFVSVIHNPHSENTKISFDMNWNELPFVTSLPKFSKIERDALKKPQKFEEMIALAKKVCKDFIFVRVDFYLCEDKIFFGEMTFTPASGYCKWCPEDQDSILGKLMTLPPNYQTTLPQKSFAEKGVVSVPDSFVLPKTETELLKATVKSKDGKIKTLEKEKNNLQKEIKKIKASKAFKVGEKIAWPVRKIRNLMK